MSCFRVLAALVLTLLALGVGVCGLCVVAAGNSGEDKSIGMGLMLLAGLMLIGGITLWTRKRSAEPEATPDEAHTAGEANTEAPPSPSDDR